MTHKDHPLSTPFPPHISRHYSVHTAGAVTSRQPLSLLQSLPAASQQSLVDRVTLSYFSLPCGVFISINVTEVLIDSLNRSSPSPSVLADVSAAVDAFDAQWGDGQARASPASWTAAWNEVPRWAERRTRPWTSCYNAQRKEGGSTDVFFYG